MQRNSYPNKDFWHRACIITSKHQNLTKAHVRYLETRFISIFRDAGHAILFNGTAPVIEELPEADIADMKYFMMQVSRLKYMSAARERAMSITIGCARASRAALI